MFALWMKAVFLFPIWAYPILWLWGRVISGTHYFSFAFFSALILGVLYFWHDFRKLHLVIENNRLRIGLRNVDLSKLVKIHCMKKDLILTFENGHTEILVLSRLSTEGLSSLIQYVRNFLPDCKIAPDVGAHLEAKRKRRISVNINFYQNHFIEQIHSSITGLMKWWREVFVQFVPILTSPWWLFLTYSVMNNGIKAHDSTSSTYGWTEQIMQSYNTIFGYLVGGSIYAAAQGINAVGQSLIIGIPSLILFLAVLIVYSKDFFSWKSFSLNGRYITFRTHHMWHTRDRLIHWKKLKRVVIHDGIVMFESDKESIGLDLKLVNAIDRDLVFSAVKENARNCIIESDELKTFQPAQHLSYTELWLQSLTHGSQNKNLLPLEIGQELQDGKFEIKKRIGTGGQGAAYLSRDSQGKEVVLKETIFPAFVDKSVRKSSLERFQSETQTLLSLDHPNIARLYEAFVEDHRGYFVLEYIKGSNLHALVKEGVLSDLAVHKLALEMCDVLEYLHSQQLIHRDFTPDNLILTEDQKLKLIDFNVAQKINDGVTGTVVGKHSYIPPEQFRGKACHQSDYYAMGATIYYLLTGQDPEPISQLNLPDIKTFDSRLKSVVFKCTALDLNHRYRSIDEIRSDLTDEGIKIDIKLKESEEIWQS